jgi:SET and MYND domain-containing protein
MRLPDEQGVVLATLHHSPNPPLPLQDIVSLNGWGFDPHPGAAYHTGIFPTYARCNHSCAPNAMARFNHGTFAIEVRAVRAIAPGEELFVSYVDVLDDHATRNRC